MSFSDRRGSSDKGNVTCNKHTPFTSLLALLFFFLSTTPSSNRPAWVEEGDHRLPCHHQECQKAKGARRPQSASCWNLILRHAVACEPVVGTGLLKRVAPEPQPLLSTPPPRASPPTSAAQIHRQPSTTSRETLFLSLEGLDLDVVAGAFLAIRSVPPHSRKSLSNLAFRRMIVLLETLGTPATGVLRSRHLSHVFPRRSVPSPFAMWTHQIDRTAGQPCTHTLASCTNPTDPKWSLACNICPWYVQ